MTPAQRILITSPYALVEITPCARKGEVLWGGWTTQGFREYVLHVQRSSGNAFRTLAVFTPIMGAFSDNAAQSWRDISHSLSRIQTYIVRLNTTLLEQVERFGLFQSEEVLLLD